MIVHLQFGFALVTFDIDQSVLGTTEITNDCI